MRAVMHLSSAASGGGRSGRLALAVFYRHVNGCSGDRRGAVLVIQRRTWLQDAVRVYKVIVDDAVIGTIGPFQTKSYPLAAGKHSLRLAMPTTGRSTSATVEVDLKSGQECMVRTVRRGGLKSFMKLPMALPEGARSLAEDRPIQSRYYEGPWIHVTVEITDS